MSSFFGTQQTTRRELLFGSIAFYDEKTALTMHFLQAVRKLTRFQKEQLDALIGGDTDLGRFDALITEAIEQKNEAKYALLQHIESHGCAA